MNLNLNQNIKLIISDFDGPIHDLNESKIVAFKSLCVHNGIIFDDFAIQTFLVLIDQYYELNRSLDYKDITQRVMNKLKSEGLINGSDSKIFNFINSFYDKLKENLIPKYSLIKTFLQIKALRPDIKLSIYTSQNKSFVSDFFSSTGTKAEIFNRVYGKEDFLEPKPSLVNLKKICKDFKVNPADAIMVGDSPVLDIMPAKFLGMNTCLVNPLVDILFESSSNPV